MGRQKFSSNNINKHFLRQLIHTWLLSYRWRTERTFLMSTRVSSSQINIHFFSENILMNLKNSLEIDFLSVQTSHVLHHCYAVSALWTSGYSPDDLIYISAYNLFSSLMTFWSVDLSHRHLGLWILSSRRITWCSH